MIALSDTFEEHIGRKLGKAARKCDRECHVRIAYNTGVGVIHDSKQLTAIQFLDPSVTLLVPV